MIKRKIDGNRKINFPIEMQRKLNIELDSDLGINIYDECFTIEKFDKKSHKEKINILDYNKILIPVFVFLTLVLNFGDTLYVRFRDNMVIFGKTLDSLYDSLAEEELRFDALIELACKSFMDDSDGQKILLKTFITIVKNSTLEKLSENFEISIDELEAEKSIKDRAKLIFAKELKRQGKELLI